MPRRAPRAPFVVTFALAASAIAGGCSSKDSGAGNGSIGDGSIGDGECPGEQPRSGTLCDLPSSVLCSYGTCPYFGGAVYISFCQQGTWSQQWACSEDENPPGPVPEAGPGVSEAGPAVHDASPDVYEGGPAVYDASPDVYEGGPDVHEGGPDGEGQDGGHD